MKNGRLVLLDGMRVSASDGGVGSSIAGVMFREKIVGSGIRIVVPDEDRARAYGERLASRLGVKKGVREVGFLNEPYDSERFFDGLRSEGGFHEKDVLVVLSYQSVVDGAVDSLIGL